MKALLTADVHFHNFQQFATVKDGVNSRLYYTREVMREFFFTARRLKADITIIAGDLFHAREKLDVDVVSEVYKLIHENEHATRSLYLLRGNHDTNSDSHSSLDIFKGLKHVNVVDNEESSEWFSNEEIAYIPHFENRDDWFRIEDRLHPAKALIMHQGITGAEVGAFNIEITGEFGLSELPTTKYGAIFAGHYHKPQHVGGNVYYLGSPLQHNFGERGENKHFTLFDTETGEVTHIPTSTPKFYIFNSLEELEQSGVDSSYHYVKVRCATKKEAGKKFPKEVLVEYRPRKEIVKQIEFQSDYDLVEAYVKDLVGEDKAKVELGKKLIQ